MLEEDRGPAEWLCGALEDQGVSPWMDICKLMPGQNWPRAIEGRHRDLRFLLRALSSRSVGKRGGFQAEIRYALDCALHIPFDEIFIVPVRLDCRSVPRAVQREIQYIDLFPDWGRGLRKLLAALRRRKAAG
jgi:hypothetical protein